MAAGDLTMAPPDLGETMAAHLRRHLEDLRGRLSGAAAAEARADDLERLLHDLTHELRTPLTVLEGTLEALAEHHATLSVREVDRLLGNARSTAARLRVLVENLLSAGAIAAGGFRPALQEVEVARLLEPVAASNAAALSSRDQVLKLDGIHQATRVLADPFWVALALINLVANASKYSPAGSTIGVTVHPEGDSMRFSVSDQGAGIPLEDQPALFTRYYRAAPDRSRPGIGLGLAIFKGIVESHGGSFGIDSAPGAGTTVWFTLHRAGEPSAP